MADCLTSCDINFRSRKRKKYFENRLTLLSSNHLRTSPRVVTIIGETLMRTFEEGLNPGAKKSTIRFKVS